MFLEISFFPPARFLVLQVGNKFCWGIIEIRWIWFQAIFKDLMLFLCRAHDLSGLSIRLQTSTDRGNCLVVNSCFQDMESDVQQSSYTHPCPFFISRAYPLLIWREVTFNICKSDGWLYLCPIIFHTSIKSIIWWICWSFSS